MLDREQIIPKIKKYLLYVSVAFFLSSCIHLTYSYLYSDAKNIALNGGSLSEAIIGDFPHLNPLVSSSDYDKYIVHALYRSILKYDSNEKKFIGDIMNCDIKNLQVIECFLNENIKWSDGSDVTTKDVVATLSLIKRTGSNPVITSLLSDTDIEDKGISIVFKTRKSDINFLNIFLQPIISQNVINQLTEAQITGKFPIKGMLYSGPYTVNSVGQDENIGIKKLTLTKNKYFSEKDFIIDTIIFKVFTDVPHFLKQKDSINIFNDKESLIGDTLPRLSVFEYTLPQYVSLFVNTEKIPDPSLRKYILNAVQRENIIKVLGGKNFREVKNPYLSDVSIDPDTGTDSIETLLKKSGYYKKEELAQALMTQANVAQKSVEEKKGIEVNTPSKVVFAPTSTKYNFISEDDVLMKGKVDDSKVQAVYINDYKLKGYTRGNTEFTYRLKVAGYNTIKEGKNVYVIAYEKDGKKQVVDEVEFYFYRDAKTLEDEKLKLTTPMKITSFSGATLEAKQKEEQNRAKVIQQIDSLDGKFLYNKNLEKLTFTLLYADTDKYIGDTAKSVQAQLEQAGIAVKLKGIDVAQLNRNLISGQKDYDIILVGVNLGYFKNNIFPYFHSSQVKQGYNFSNFRKLSLDILLEDLKSSSMAEDKIQEEENKALKIIKQESIVKTLYTPIMKQLVDKNIKGYTLPKAIPSDTLLFDGLKNAYILQKRIVNYSQKSISGFFVFMWKSLFS